MKKAELRKKIKISQCEFDASQGNWGIFKGILTLTYFDESWNERKTLLCVDCQANDLTHPDHGGKPKPDPVRSFREFPGLSGWYGCEVKCRERFDLMVSDSENPETAAHFFELIREVIDAKNLNYVHPDCPMARIVAALESLGCGLHDVTVNRKPRLDWARTRRAPEECAV